MPRSPVLQYGILVHICMGLPRSFNGCLARFQLGLPDAFNFSRFMRATNCAMSASTVIDKDIFDIYVSGTSVSSSAENASPADSRALNP